MIEKLHLKNFTAFDDLELKLSPKINVIIGENGTGKTQLLKALYFCNKALASQTPSAEDLLHTFRPSSLSLKALVGNDGKTKAEVHCELATGQAMEVSFSANSKHKALPLNHKEWSMPFAESCLIVNLATYKTIFGADSVRRISDSE